MNANADARERHTCITSAISRTLEHRNLSAASFSYSLSSLVKTSELKASRHNPCYSPSLNPSITMSSAYSLLNSYIHHPTYPPKHRSTHKPIIHSFTHSSIYPPSHPPIQTADKAESGETCAPRNAPRKVEYIPMTRLCSNHLLGETPAWTMIYGWKGKRWGWGGDSGLILIHIGLTRTGIIRWEHYDVKQKFSVRAGFKSQGSFEFILLSGLSFSSSENIGIGKTTSN